MRLGLSTAAFYGRTETEDSASAIAALPLDCAEVFLQTASEYTAAFGREVRARFGGMPCASVHPLGTQFENGMFSRSARQRGDAYDVFRRVLDAGSALGAGVYVYHGRYSPQIVHLPWNLQANAEALGPMIEEAATRGMEIAWENVAWCQLTEASRVLEARQALPRVRFTLDIKQAMRAGSDPFELAKAMGDRLANVHLCDWDAAGKLCLPGEGAFDFEGFLVQLARIGYDGPVIMEPYLSLISNEEALRASIAFLREKMKRAESISGGLTII